MKFFLVQYKLSLSILMLLFSLLFLSSPVLAQSDSLKMTLTPPLIKNNMIPGETWVSTIKLVNNNKEKLTLYTEIQDFRSSPEGGVELIPIEESEGDGNQSGFLRQWMQIKKGPFVVEPFASIEIPFEIKVPEVAEPGGHYAAILVGTKPSGKVEGSGLSISSMISSLVLISIAGDVVEEGRIREFSTDKTYYKNPEINFKLRFENTGNVHLQPRGNITIKDMFGNEKGIIDINKDTAYGNVLPKSITSWDFFWEGESGLFKMGKYNAVLNLYYGEQSAEVDTRTFYFWYADFKVLGIILGSILGFFLFIFLIIKLYIKRAIKQSQKEIEKIKELNNPMASSAIDRGVAEDKVETVINQNSPHRSSKRGVLDLRKTMKKNKS